MMTNDLLGLDVIEVRATKFLVLDAVVEDVPGGDQDAAHHRHRGLLGSASPEDASEQGREVGAAFACGPQETSMSAPRSQRLPLRVLPLRRLPALSEFPGHTPAHEARWAALGKGGMSIPTT